MSSQYRPRVLHGRLAEQSVIDALLGRVRQGHSGALVIVGEPGIGKTALLDYAAAHSDGLRVLRGTGVESEAELAFASLHLLLGPVLDRLDGLPDQQRTALSGALGLGPAGSGDRFLIALAVLSLLSELAEERPLVCLLDDVQWLDRASATALQFVARRLEGEGVAMVFAARDSGPAFVTPGIAELRLGGLDGDASAALLAERGGGLPTAVREAILTQARGNPLALIELPAVAEPGESYGVPGLAPMPVTSRVQDVFGHQVRSLPATTQTLLLTAAANDSGALAPLLRAGAALGAGIADLAPAEQSGLIALTTGKLVFRHPLVRAAIYHGASRSARIAVHTALADAFGESGDAARRAWHRAAAAIGPDEDVATDLERAASSAAALGGHAAVAAACERAAELSEDAEAAIRRLTLACEAAAMAGDLDRVIELAAQATDQADDKQLRARLSHVRGSAYFALGSLRDAHAVLIAAAATVTDDPVRAFWMVTEALHSAWQLPLDRGMLAATVDAFGALDLPDDHPLMSLVWLMRWCVAMPIGRDTEGLQPLPGVIARAGSAGRSDGPRGLTAVAACALVVGRDDVAAEITESLIADSRNRGIMGWLPAGLTYLATAKMCLGEHRGAVVYGAEALRAAQDTGQRKWINHAAGPLAYLAAVQGDERRCREHARTAMAPLAADLAQPAVGWAEAALALLDLGQGRPEDALGQLDALISGPARFMVGAVRSSPDHVEAAIRSGHPERAAEPLDRFETWAAQMGQPWADALLARCRALVAPDSCAEQHYESALKLHEAGPRPFDRARTQLVYGEWLRRMRRKNEARAQLSAALGVFSSLGADPWSNRARAELHAAGAQVPEATRPDVFAVLTPQEFQIIQLAARGMSNRDIAAQLFLSTRTVAYHLYKAYPKLGIAGRTEIPALLASSGSLGSSGSSGGPELLIPVRIPSAPAFPNVVTMTDTITSFRVDIPQADLDELAGRLARSRWANELPLSEVTDGIQKGPVQPGWEYGVPLEYVQRLVAYWRESYDWRKWEAKLNGYPQFTTTIDGQNIHFLHVRSARPDAIPLILTHGWPNSVVEYLDLIDALVDPPAGETAFHLVIPSLPGFAFSGPTTQKGWDSQRIARAWAELMRRLGYDRYGAAGNDAGAQVSPEVGRADPEHVIGVHVTQIFSFPSGDPAEFDGLPPEDLEKLQFLKAFNDEMSAYAQLQSTKPQNLAHALADSPAGQLAWTGQLLAEAVHPEVVITNAAIYWLTNTAASSARMYYEVAHAAQPAEPTTVPIGLAAFAYDFRSIRRFAERDHASIVSWNEYDRGGHWSAHDAPDLLIADLRQFFRRFQ